MDTLDQFVEDNEFPIVFIGSGISKRYLKDFPNWNELLKHFWELSGENNYFGEFNNLRDSLKESHPELGQNKINHMAYIEMGRQIETNFNRAFNNEKIDLGEFTPEKAYYENVSPFKKAISMYFSDYTLKDNFESELESFENMLLKAQIILTTNYDEFIENSYNSLSQYDVQKFVGQKGFFKDNIGFAELYKIHGCVTEPNSITITDEDYDKFNKNSVLISSKIISLMFNSPIIFIGYSLTDVNVRKIISDFATSLEDNELAKLEERILLIDREEGEENFIEEVNTDTDIGCKIKVLKTDNYKRVYDKISKIDQGVAPTEIRKYQHIIKDLIIDQGKEGALDTVLLTGEELDCFLQ